MNEWISKCICRETGCVQFLSDFLFIFASARKYMRCTCAFKDEVGLCASAVHKSSGLQCKGALPYAPTSHHFQLGKTSRKNIFTYPKTGHADTEHFGNEQTLNAFTSVSARDVHHTAQYCAKNRKITEKNVCEIGQSDREQPSETGCSADVINRSSFSSDISAFLCALESSISASIRGCLCSDARCGKHSI